MPVAPGLAPTAARGFTSDRTPRRSIGVSAPIAGTAGDAVHGTRVKRPTTALTQPRAVPGFSPPGDDLSAGPPA